MVADGEMRQVEAARDLLVRLFLGDQGQDFDLSLGQRLGESFARMLSPLL